MAELLIMQADVPASSDQAVTAMQFQRGMVITVQEDGYGWGAGDLDGHAKLVKLPGVPASSVAHLTAVMLDEAPSLGATPTVSLLRIYQANDVAALPTVVSLASLLQADVDAWVAANFTLLTAVPLDDPRIIG